MNQVYQIMSGMDRIEPGLFFHQPVHTGTRGHSQKIHIYTEYGVLWRILLLRPETTVIVTPYSVYIWYQGIKKFAQNSGHLADTFGLCIRY